MIRIVLSMVSFTLIGCAKTAPCPKVSAFPSEHAHAEQPDAVFVHAPFDEYYSCSEHYDGQFKWMGDALGTDCVVTRLAARDGRAWARAYKSDGRTNEDWFGWQKPVLAPFDGKIVKLNVNPKPNEPGVIGEGMASFVVVERSDGTNVMYAHLDRLSVNGGDSVKAGQVLGTVGNNGHARHPHVHIGAWKGKVPLQLRFDQRTMGKVTSE